MPRRKREPSRIGSRVCGDGTDTHPSSDVGTRLRTVREAHGISQRELARRAGVTNGTVSLIENNQSSPSVAMLKKILEAFPMALVEFFSLDLPEPTPIFFTHDELTELTTPFTRGSVSFRQIGGGRSAGQRLQMLYERYAPTADTGKSMLVHKGEEGGFVLAGKALITVGSEERLLGPGDAYYFDSNAPHRFRNVGEDECIIVSACTPPFL